MKRSTINSAIRQAMRVLRDANFTLPAFGYWQTGEWRQNADKTHEIASLMLGWDVTDFGMGSFESTGAVLFTLRNGCVGDASIGVPYAEKIIYLTKDTGQEIPFHYHELKTEDIINRAGGVLLLELYNAAPDGSLDKSRDVTLKMDGIAHTFAPGETVRVPPGCSITLPPGLYHRFWADRDSDELIIGEVSSINDDNTDNVFLSPISRFSIIEEDEPALYPLCNEYAALLCEGPGHV